MLGVLAYAGPLDYGGRPFPVEVVEKTTLSDGTTEELIKFPSPVKSLFASNNTVWGHLLLPAPGVPGAGVPPPSSTGSGLPSGQGPRACILVLPVMAAPNVVIERRFMNRFLREGFAVMWLEMPYQFRRRPLPSIPSGQVFLARSAPKLAANFRQSALDARRALEWLSREPRVDPKRIGLFGISLGALVGSVVYSVDETPKYAVLLLGGADFPTLVADGSMTGPFIRRLGIGVDSLREAFRGFDALDYAKENAEKPALLINARSDTVIPKANGLKLKEAFPRARQKWVPLGHYSGIIHLIWLPRYVARDFRRNL